MPPPLLPAERPGEPLDVIPVLTGWVRGTLLGITLGLVTVFVIAWRLDPYVRPTPQDHPEFVAVLATAPGAGLPASVPWAALSLSQEADVKPAALQMGTHRQLGLLPCNFYLMTGMPCPSCGMTTSFALLMQGDVANSLKANAVGTLLALFGLAVIPWALACALCGRSFFVLSMERALLAVIVVFLSLMLLRWAVVLGLIGWERIQF